MAIQFLVTTGFVYPPEGHAPLVMITTSPKKALARAWRIAAYRLSEAEDHNFLGAFVQGQRPTGGPTQGMGPVFTNELGWDTTKTGVLALLTGRSIPIPDLRLPTPGVDVRLYGTKTTMDPDKLTVLRSVRSFQWVEIRPVKLGHEYQ